MATGSRGYGVIYEEHGIAQPGGRTTIKDVAAHAGVSTQTVSRVINDRPDVAPDTRHRVAAAISALNYRPSAVARTLVARHSKAIGVLLAGMGYTGTSQALQGIIDEAGQLGLTVLIAELPEGEVIDDPSPAISALIERHVDGIVMMVPSIGRSVDRINAALSDRFEPVVLVKAGISDDHSSVVVDNIGATVLAVDHLISIGRTRIAHISGPLAWHEANDRLAGWRQALAAHKLPSDSTQVESGDWSSRSGAVAMGGLLDRIGDLDSVVVANDRMALGAMHTLRGRGIRIPEDVAITGFDDIPEAAWLAPPLTSISQPLEEMGRLSVRTLREHVENNSAGPATISLDAELVIRESTVGPT